MRFNSLLLYILLYACVFTNSYATEKKDSEDSSSKMVSGAGSNPGTADQYQQDPPVLYQSTDRSLFLLNLMEINTSDQDMLSDKQNQRQAHARIEHALVILERIPNENDILSLVFQNCLFETEHFLRRLLESCIGGETKKLKGLEFISFDDVIFTDSSFQVLTDHKKLKGCTVNFSNCGITEELVSQDTQDRTQEAKQKILARYAQYLRAQTTPTVRFANLRAFANLWDTTSKQLPISPRLIAPEETEKSPRAKSDEGAASEERAKEARQQIFAGLIRFLPTQSIPVSEDTSLRAFAKLRQKTLKEKELPVSPRTVNTSEKGQDRSSAKSVEPDERSTSS